MQTQTQNIMLNMKQTNQWFRCGIFAFSIGLFFSSRGIYWVRSILLSKNDEPHVQQQRTTSGQQLHSQHLIIGN